MNNTTRATLWYVAGIFIAPAIPALFEKFGLIRKFDVLIDYRYHRLVSEWVVALYMVCIWIGLTVIVGFAMSRTYDWWKGEAPPNH